MCVCVTRECDGQVDHESLVAKLQEVNEEQLKNVQPKLLQLLQDRSSTAINKLQRQALRTQQGAQGQKLKFKAAKRRYAFAPPNTSDNKAPTQPSQLETLESLESPLDDSPRWLEGDDGDVISTQAQADATTPRADALTPKSLSSTGASLAKTLPADLLTQ